MVTAWEPTRPDRTHHRRREIHLVVQGTQHPPVLLEVPWPADPEPWKAGVDDSAEPPMVVTMHDSPDGCRIARRFPSLFGC